MRLLLKILAAVLLTALLLPVAFAQDAEEKSSLIQFVEGKLSTPNMQIRLNGIQGTLSSDVSFASITIADEEGIWLEITKPQLIWTRTALFSGRLEIDSLTAEKIDIKRKPLADENLPSAEARPFAVPELPVAVILKKLSVPLIAFSPTVFGLESEASIEGSMTLDGGSLDLDLDVNRLDGPGGQLKALAKYDGGKKDIELDVSLNEPEGGIVATLIGIEDQPPVELTIKGNAPVEDLTVALAFDVDTKRILDGDLTFTGTVEGLRASANLGGPLASILSDKKKAFFGENSRLTAEMLIPEAGGFLLEDARLVSGNLRLAANAATQPDGYLTALNLNFKLAAEENNRVSLPVEGQDLSLKEAGLVLRYDVERRDQWDGFVIASDVRASDFQIAKFGIKIDGTVENVRDTTLRLLTFSLAGGVDGIEADDPGFAEAIGTKISISGRGEKKGNTPLLLKNFAIAGATFRTEASGEFADGAFDGQIALETTNLAAFSQVAERDLSGSTKLTASGKIFPISGGFDLVLDGFAKSLSIGEERVDPLLAGESTLKGGVARTVDGTAFRQFQIVNSQMEARIDGALSSESANMLANVEILDLGTISPDAAGPVTLKASLTGEQKPFDLRAALQMSDGMLAGRTTRDLALTFEGNSDAETLAGKLAAQGFVADESISLNAHIDVGAERLSLRGLVAEIGKTIVNGSLERGNNGVFDGDISIDSTDIGTVAALALVKASGSLKGRAKLSAGENSTQSANADIKASKLVYGDITVGNADIKAVIEDLFGVPVIDAEASGSDIHASGVTVRTFSGTALSSGAKTDFKINAALAQNETRISANGQMTRSGQVTDVALENLQLNSTIADARLKSPARISLNEEAARVSGLDLAVGSGSVRIDGTAGKALDLTAALTSLPLAIANAIRPETGAAGTLSGRIKVTGTSASPAVDYQLTGEGVSARQISELGLSPLGLSANGSFRNDVVVLDNARVNNADGIAVTASGRLPLNGSGVNLAVEGSAPVSLAQRFLASRSATVSGKAQFNATISGSLANPRTNGLLSISGGTLTDPLSNLKLENIGLIAGLNGEQVSINRLEARLASGGNVSAKGTITASGAFPASINVNLTGARYTDGQTFSTALDGRLAVSGDLMRDPLLSGDLNLGPTEIIVPENFAADVSLLKVDHVAPGQKTSATLKRLQKATPAPKPSSRPSVLRLSVMVNAPTQIFVRGRGLDAELGGSMRLTGPVTNVTPIGRFDLRRGRLDILGQRLDLGEGSITMTGDLDPLLDFLARTRSSNIDAYIRLKGRASNLEVTFSSAQGLPDDEVLAGIVFGRRISELSPVQIAKLASIASELTGGNNVSLVERLRRGAGLDDLDVVQDEEGGTAVKAGRYVQDNVYLGVEVGKETEATINMDLTDNLRARGAVSSKGETSIGVFFEKDY